MSDQSEVPSTWLKVRLRDVINYGEGEKVEPTEIMPDDWVLELEDIEKDTSRILQRVTFSRRISKSTKCRFAKGDILFGKLRPYLNKVLIADQSGFCTTEIVPLKPNIGIDGRYLFYWLKNPIFTNYVSSVSHGLNMPRLGTEAGINSPFILAPLNEQKRIAGKLDSLVSRVDICRTHLDRVPGIINRFRQAILFMATNGQLTKDWRIKIGLENEEHQDSTKSFDFPDTECFGIYEFPVSWEIHRLGEIADITGGITKDSKKQNPNDEEIPYLRVANVQRGFLDLNEIKTIRVPADRLDELRLQPGDILFNEGGDLDKLGRGWIWSGEIEPCVFQNHVFRARLKDERYSPKFFSFYGNSRGYDYFLTYGKQTTNLASINKSLLEALPVVVPHPDEQHEIVRRIEVLFAHADQLEARYRSAKELVESLPGVILGKAFRGELVPQDPNDEPAAVLLERIKLEREKQAQLPKPNRKVTKPRETKMTESELKEIIRKLPKDTFSFDDLRERIPGDYEQIKRLLFSVLSETDAIIKQVFDPNAEGIRFIRRER